jgi:FkbM family methyltransferase
MSLLLIERIVRGKPLINFMNSVVSRYLVSKSNELIDKRGFPIAVFGNDWIGINIFLNGVYEDDLIEDFFLVLSKIHLNTHEMTIVDAGANIGNHSIQFSRKFGKVFSFEPNPRAYEILNSNTKRIKNIVSFNLALGREKATLKLKETWSNMGGSSAAMDVFSNSVVDIQVTTLDDLSTLLGKIDAIKIDVEGMELDVLLGAAKVISKDHPIICFEQHESEFVSEFNETASIDYLRSLGYRLFSYKIYKPSPWPVCGFRNVYGLFFGKVKKRVIVEYDKLPQKGYSMIFAIHSSNL